MSAMWYRDGMTRRGEIAGSHGAKPEGRGGESLCGHGLQITTTAVCMFHRGGEPRRFPSSQGRPEFTPEQEARIMEAWKESKDPARYLPGMLRQRSFSSIWMTKWPRVRMSNSRSLVMKSARTRISTRHSSGFRLASAPLSNTLSLSSKSTVWLRNCVTMDSKAG